MKFSEIAGRLTGFSCPIFGVEWSPPEADITRARRVITFLEDRRVLYVDSQMEQPASCARSVHEIRRFLTEELSAMESNNDLAKNLKAMRAACRKFLGRTENQDRDILEFGSHRSDWASWVFNGALGEMRGVFGIHLAQIAAKYGLDIEDDLAAILPAGDDNTPIAKYSSG